MVGVGGYVRVWSWYNMSPVVAAQGQELPGLLVPVFYYY